jgi:RNA polymerase sigma factor (sigma-70 family)
VTVTLAAREPLVHRIGNESVQLTFERRFDDLYATALRPANRILQNRDEAEDVAAETLARLYERWEKLSTHPELRAWVARVATNLSLDHIKRRRTTPVSLKDSAEQPEFALERMEVARAIRSLPRRQREVIALRYFADLPDAEVALILQISHATERTHLQRALAALRPRFELLKEKNDDVE